MLVARRQAEQNFAKQIILEETTVNENCMLDLVTHCITPWTISDQQNDKLIMCWLRLRL